MINDFNTTKSRALRITKSNTQPPCVKESNKMLQLATDLHRLCPEAQVKGLSGTKIEKAYFLLAAQNNGGLMSV
jgi:hypothetical protein